MLEYLTLIGGVAAVAAIWLTDRARLRAVLDLDLERRAHALTRSERDGLRDSLDRATAERDRLERKIEEVKALHAGGAYR